MSGIFIGGYSEDYEGDTIVAVGLNLAAVKRETLTETKRMYGSGWQDRAWVQCYTNGSLSKLTQVLDYNRKERRWSVRSWSVSA